MINGGQANTVEVYTDEQVHMHISERSKQEGGNEAKSNAETTKLQNKDRHAQRQKAVNVYLHKS